MQQNKEAIVIRSYTNLDRNFILATWLRGLYYGDTWYNAIPKSIFMENYHRVLEKFLPHPSVTIKVACLKEDPEIILGYSVSRNIKYGEADIAVLDWIFVKSAWRKIGVAKMLLPSKINACTHLTKTGLSILKQKLPNVIFNPFLM
jgi:hypothetical protein